jgi:hypothetical protein
VKGRGEARLVGNLNRKLGEAKLDGNIIIAELMRNMELGRFEMAYTVLLPCVFTIYLNPEDHATLSGVFDLIADDAKRALRARVTELNSPVTVLGVRRGTKPAREFKIAMKDWGVEFFSDPEVPRGDVEIHSELSETPQPGYRGTKTTLLGREPAVTAGHTTSQRSDRYGSAAGAPDSVFAEVRYEDDSGKQVYLLRQNQLRIGRGGGEKAVDLALYTNDEVSREHLTIRRDAAAGTFFITDTSTNGTWMDGKRLKRGVEEILPPRSEIGVGEVLTLSFEIRK